MTEKLECFETLGKDISLTEYSECFDSMNPQDCYSTKCLANKHVKEAVIGEEESEKAKRGDTKEATTKNIIYI